METKKIRLLTAGEIECRVGSGGKNGDKWCTILLYKDARVDMRMLDEVFGPSNWKRTHELINGNLFCTVSIWDSEKKEWVGKQDVGVESYTEKEKGQASDAFKRACFNWGIGRELYSAPTIFISLSDNDYKNGKLATRFRLTDIAYNGGEVSYLRIVDGKGVKRYEFGKQEYEFGVNKEMDAVVKELEACATKEEFIAAFKRHPEYYAHEAYKNKAREIQATFK